MNILVGHANMDMDCLGSLALGKYLFPGFVPVRSRLIHPVAKNLYNLYKNHLKMMRSKELKGQDLEKIVIFDTRSYAKIREYVEQASSWKGEAEIFDHHLTDSSDISGAIVHEAAVGANTTMLATRLMEKGEVIHPDDATIALAGIFADTGNFTHDNITVDDFSAASWLMGQGASMKLVREFVKVLSQDYQINLFHRVLNSMVIKKIHGHEIIFTYIELPEQINGLAAVVEKAFEVENPDAMFGVFTFEKSRNSLIVCRSQRDDINCSEIMKHWGGGGHDRAAAAGIKKQFGEIVFQELLRFLDVALLPAVSAREIMTGNVMVVNEKWKILEASLYLEEVSHTGAPVVDDEGKLKGILTLRDISKARQAGQMKAPVSGYMTRKVYSCSVDSTLRDIGMMMQIRNIGHLPVLEDGFVVGILTRNDYIKYIRQ